MAHRPQQLLFQAPGQAVPSPAPGTGPAGVDGPAVVDRPCCELPGCDAVVPHSPGNEDTIRYCSRAHRREARARRSRARNGDR